MDDAPKLWEPLQRQLALHPDYQKIFRECIDRLFYGDGPLPLPERHFLALMGSSRHRCKFLINLHRQEFVRLGGDAGWLSGVDAVPEKISKLDIINRVLAHQPWLLRASHLEELSRGAGANWSLSELVQAAVLLSHTHALCSFIAGSGVAAEPATSASSNGAPASDGKSSGPLEVLMERMRELSESHSQSSQEDRERHFADIHLESSGIASDQSCDGIVQSNGGAQFTKDLQFGYIDFAQRNEAAVAPTLKIHDFSWEDQGCSVVSQLYGEIGPSLDGKFQLTQQLTYNRIGHLENVDTTKYRLAVWNYIQSLYGIRHDDYDYAEVNQLVDRPSKTLVKTVCCFPERTSAALRAGALSAFDYSERVHVLLMILEARLQAELLYVLRAIMRFMTA